jgi:hypothetical protein
MLLCPTCSLHDPSSTELAKVFVSFDETFYDGDEVRYGGDVAEIRGSYDPETKTLVLSALEGKHCQVEIERNAANLGMSPYYENLSGDRRCGGFKTAPVALFERALRTVRYKARESLSVTDTPNRHTRVVRIAAEDAEGWRGDAFAINVTVASASTVLTDRSYTRHGR